MGTARPGPVGPTSTQEPPAARTQHPVVSALPPRRSRHPVPGLHQARPDPRLATQGGRHRRHQSFRRQGWGSHGPGLPGGQAARRAAHPGAQVLASGSASPGRSTTSWPTHWEAVRPARRGTPRIRHPQPLDRLAVLAIWVAIALAAAAILLRRRDAWLTPLPNPRFPSVELATALPDGGTEDADAQVLGQAHGGRRHRARVAISYHRANRTVPGRSPQDPGGFEGAAISPPPSLGCSESSFPVNGAAAAWCLRQLS